MKKRILSLMIILVLAFAVLAGCFGTLEDEIDSDKKQIYISVYLGGLGADWLDPVIEAFEKDYPEYEIVLEKKKRTVEEIQNLIAIGKQADAYFSTVSDFHIEIYKDNLVDLSDILEMDVDGNGVKVKDKMIDYDKWKRVSSKNGNGIYMLPYDESFVGFVYDHGKFLDYGLLIYAENSSEVKAELQSQGIQYTEEGNKLKFVSAERRVNYKPGDYILRAGKDGLYGTYDDGQPITISEWNTMLNWLKGIGKGIIYSGKILDYVTEVFNGIFAQYEGSAGWELINSFEGEYHFAGDAEPTPISMQNGYMVYKMEGFNQALNFLQTYLNNREYVHDAAFVSEESHTDVQGKFVVGSAKPSVYSPFTGLLVEGTWWEKEAAGVNIFKDLSEGRSAVPGFNYGERDYRIMLYPNLEGQKGADGNGNGSALSVRSTGSIIVPKNDDEDILEKTKIFISYTLKDEFLRTFTVKTGSVRPFKYTLTDEDRASMTKFANTVWDMYNDRVTNEGGNILFVRPLLDRYVTQLPYKTSKGFAVNYYFKINDVSYNMPIIALRQAEVSVIKDIRDNPVKYAFEGLYNHFRPLWSQFLNELNG